MMRHELLEHAFVEHIPEKVKPGILYVSMEYGTAAHSCCCGCGEEIVTPFTPTDWKMIFDGETVSLNPSIGNWTLDCRSHYVIKRGRVIEAGPWTDEQVAAERLRDRKVKSRHYAQQPEVRKAPGHALDLEHETEAKSIWQRIWHFIR
ncbi:DUF6527 family protein [Aestuariibius insulae]|uniref:DUF6527 family protein n=1 Tax=Aestuariibius insulae TaxID=2058287 RepID=UPI00345E9F41